jgi:hypothetical protein
LPPLGARLRVESAGSGVSHMFPEQSVTDVSA